MENIMNQKKISVALASYNGQAYIAQQIESILQNLRPQDELWISDDGSLDNTIHILAEYQKKDARVHLCQGPGRGVKQNFANAISHTTGDIILLSDQDDIWADNKVERVLEAFETSKKKLVVHDAAVVKADGQTELAPSFFKLRGSGAGVLKNIWKNTYIGCCMAFSASLKPLILPIPEDIEMHDQWIGVLCDQYAGGSYFLPETLLRYRRHDANASAMKHYPLGRMIKNRVNFIRNLKRVSTSKAQGMEM